MVSTLATGRVRSLTALIGHQLALSDANWLTASDGKEPVGAIDAPRQRPLTGKFPGDIDRLGVGRGGSVDLDVSMSGERTAGGVTFV
jgi:hypothetical protein